MLDMAGLLTAAAVGTALAVSPAPAADSSPGLGGAVAEPKLRESLVERLVDAQQDELIPITIILREQAPVHEMALARAIDDKRQRRAAMISTLKETAARSSQPLVASLEKDQSRGLVGERIRSLWIANVVAMEAAPEVIHRLAQRADVAYINYDRPVGPEVFPVEPDMGEGLEGLPGPLNLEPIECGVEIMRAPEVWDEFGITGEGVVVGVIDTGCCWEHPDLINQVWNNPGEIPDNGIDDDENGYIDDIVGWNFEDDTNDPYDTSSHGTHVAGTVGGDGTQGTKTGMAPDVSLMILKYWNSFSGESVAWEAIQYGVNNGADVLTGSFGWPHYMSPDRATWREICDNAMATGTVMNFAAGNEGTSSPPVDNVRTPGDVPDILTVGGTDCSDDDYSSSSRGPVTWQDVPPYSDWPYPPGKMKPTISAPSVDTYSTSNDCVGYSTKTGTSMGTPHVAGAVALILQANPSLDHFSVKQILMETSVDLGEPGTDIVFGAGRVDVYEAVVLAMSQVSSADINCDGVVDVLDLIMLLAAWGPCPGCPEDVNGDDVVDVLDLIEVLAAWGTSG